MEKCPEMTPTLFNAELKFEISVIFTYQFTDILICICNQNPKVYNYFFSDDL